MHLEQTWNRCEVNSSVEHLLPLHCFKMPNCHTAILKWEFGIGPRDKQKLNFEWETKVSAWGQGALPLTSDWINTSHGHGLGQGKVGKVATGGYGRAEVEDSHLRCHLSQLWMNGWTDEQMKMKMLCQCQTWVQTDEMDDGVLSQWNWQMVLSLCGGSFFRVFLGEVPDQAVLALLFWAACEPPSYFLPLMHLLSSVSFTWILNLWAMCFHAACVMEIAFSITVVDGSVATRYSVALSLCPLSVSSASNLGKTILASLDLLHPCWAFLWVKGTSAWISPVWLSWNMGQTDHL